MSEHTLTVLGCDGSYPGPGGAASGYLVHAGSTTIWLDAGPGTFANLQQRMDPGSLDAIVLSHEHPDHWTDLESFAVWGLLHAAPALAVYAPPGLRERSYFADRAPLAWHTIEPAQELRIGDLGFRFASTDHGPLTLAMRIDAVEPGGELTTRRALAYTADSGPGWSAEELGSGLGTVLCEASYTKRDEKPVYRHMSGRQAGAMAASAGVRRLIVTHRWPTVSADELVVEVESAFGGPVEQAVAGETYAW
jgi:ribonuclease BN (tRNA processing enzyme)